jgi:thioredoxin reductase
VTDANRIADRFRVSLRNGASEETRFLLIATGVVDDLPAISGLTACYGRSVFRYPYCDGWEWKDRRLAVVGRGVEAVRLALGLKTWSADIVLCTHGRRITGSEAERAGHNQIAVRTEPIAAVAINQALQREELRG